MPAAVLSNDIDRFPVARGIGHQQLPVIRPFRQSLFHNPDWPPAPERDPPTPAAVRAARSRMLSIRGRSPALDKASAISHSRLSARPARAQQMQARALAAQAAHQKRFAAGLSLPTTLLPVPPQTPPAENAGFMLVDGDIGLPTQQYALDPGSSFSYPPLNLDESMDIMDEIQVDLSLTLLEGPPSPIDESLPFLSPSAVVDISDLLPPPGPPVLVANEATIAASAVPLAEWAADLCGVLLSRTLIPKPGVPDDHAQWKDLLTIGSTRRDGLSSKAFVIPPVFRKFVHDTLSATLPSPQCLFLGFFYLFKLPIGFLDCLPPELDNAHTPAGVLALFESLNAPSGSSRQYRFRKILYGNADQLDPGIAAVQVAQSVFTLALMLGNKWLEDNTFTTRTWHDVTSLAQYHLKDLETAALDIFDFSLIVGDRDWVGWLAVLRSYTSQLVAREPIGRLASANATVLGRIDELSQSINAFGRPLWLTESPFFPADNIIMHGQQLENGEHHQPITTKVRHSRTASLPVSSDHLPFINSAFCNIDTTREKPSHEISFAQSLDALQYFSSDGFVMTSSTTFGAPFQLLAPHPDVLNTKKRTSHLDLVPTYVTEPRHYRWDQVLAEIAAQELERDNLVSGWPRPSRLDWTGPWSHLTTTVVGV